jgi:tRNA pseudouridine38-40 synthase
VQGEVELALGTALGLDPPPGLTVAGRTDAGVHALGQVAHADLPGPVPAHLCRRLNGVLPPDVRVHRAGPAPAGFDARFSALSRVYAYRVTDRVPNPLRRHDTLAHVRRLDPARMAAAAAGLLGEHDFAAYCRRREGGGSVRRLSALSVVRDPEAVVVLTAEADAFCHSMVRALVGALLAVGDGRRDVEWPAAVLARGARDAAVTVARPHGLTLLTVRYSADEELAERAVLTRSRRSPAAQTTV